MESFTQPIECTMFPPYPTTYHILHSATCPGYGNLPTRLLQLLTCKSASLHHPAATAHPECCGPSHLQPSKVFPTSRPCHGHPTGYQLLLGSDSNFWLWPTLQPTRWPLPTYRTSFRPTHRLDHSALLPQAALPILPAVRLALARPDCGASPPSLPSGGMTPPFP